MALTRFGQTAVIATAIGVASVFVTAAGPAFAANLAVDAVTQDTVLALPAHMLDALAYLVTMPGDVPVL